MSMKKLKSNNELFQQVSDFYDIFRNCIVILAVIIVYHFSIHMLMSINLFTDFIVQNLFWFNLLSMLLLLLGIIALIVLKFCIDGLMMTWHNIDINNGMKGEIDE